MAAMSAADLVEELRLWREGKRSTNNRYRGQLADGPDRIGNETRLIAESDNAQIVALAAELNYALAQESA